MIRLVLVGTGNVSKAIARAVQKTNKINLISVIGRNNQLSTAYPVKVPYATNPSKLPECDLILLTVQDQMIKSVSDKLVSNHAVVAHTSGASNIDLLSAHKHRGVLYPIQTFSDKSRLEWKNIPICWEANTLKTQKILKEVAQSLGVNKIVALDHQKRTVLHLGAVLANNFSNKLFDSAQQLLEQNQLDFELLKPLILETAYKITKQSPAESQTGPARRGDRLTIKKHMSIINNEALLEVYKTFTNQILNAYEHEKL